MFRGKHMERIKLQELINWYKKKRRKPLVIWGARQVGKTYLIKNIFAKRYFKDFLYIDLKMLFFRNLSHRKQKCYTRKAQALLKTLLPPL